MKRISYFFKNIEDLFTHKITSKFRVFQQPQYMIKKVMLVFKSKGLFSVFIILFKKIFRLKIKDFKKYQELFFNKNGLEIGGPSNLFKKRDLLPIYNVIKNLDGCNFSSKTIWEGELKEGKSYKYDKSKLGYQYICDGTNLVKIPSEYYDFVLSCNSLEHIANPLKAIKEWLRVIKPKGILLLVLPNKDTNFDHKRLVTSFDHLLSDFEKNIREDDLSHLDEILKLHDLSLDPPAGNFNHFRERSLKIVENRCLHHHVFDLQLLQKIMSFFNVEVLLSDDIGLDYIIAGRKK